MIGLFGHLKYIGPHQTQVHEACGWDTLLTPLRHRGLGDTKHTGHRGGPAEKVYLFGIGVFLIHAAKISYS